jgi:hypothetical protein
MRVWARRRGRMINHLCFILLVSAILLACSPSRNPGTISSENHTSFGLEAPAAKALFVIRNFTRVSWEINVGSQVLHVPAYTSGQGFSEGILVLDPGIYRWKAFSKEAGGYMASDPEGETNLSCIVREKDVYFVRLMSLNPLTSTLKYVMESALSPNK